MQGRARRSVEEGAASRRSYPLPFDCQLLPARRRLRQGRCAHCRHHRQCLHHHCFRAEQQLDALFGGDSARNRPQGHTLQVACRYTTPISCQLSSIVSSVSFFSNGDACVRPRLHLIIPLVRAFAKSSGKIPKNEERYNDSRERSQCDKRSDQSP